jgi:small-conductance mechanosensitive channel
MNFRLDVNQAWTLITPAIWTAITVGAGYLVGVLINAIVIGRLRKLAEKTHGQWDDIVIVELGKRIPFWSLLIAAWVSLGYWELPPRWASLVTNVLRAAGVLSVTLAAASMATRLVSSYGPQITPGVPVSGLMRNVVRLVIVILGVLVILHGVGVEITPMLAALGVGGLAVALALQEPLSNLFAGIFITFAGQLRIGDYVKLDAGVEGVISDFNWHSTRIQALAGNLIIVPNAKLAQAIVSNFSLPGPDIGFGVDVVVEHGSDLATVERIALEVGREVMQSVPGAVPTAEPGVRFSGFTDLGVKVGVGLRIKSYADQFLVRHEVIKRLTSRFADAGIHMPAVGVRPR